MDFKKDKINLSFITISLDCSDLLHNTIKSILLETGKITKSDFGFEIVVVSPDLNCAQLEHVKYFYRERKGIYDAMNWALNQASGNFIWFINSGDEAYNISEVIGTIYENPGYDIYGFPVYLNNPEGKLHRPRFTSPHQGTIYRSNIFNVLRFDTKLSITADRDLFDRCREQRKSMFFGSTPAAIFMTDGISSKKRKLKARFQDGIYELTHRQISLLRVWRFLRYIF